MIRSKSLRRRLTWFVILTLLLMTAVSGSLIYRGTTHEADEIFSASLVQTAHILDGLITRETLITHREQLQAALQRPRVHEYERKLFFVVLDNSEQVLLQSLKAPRVPHEVVSEGFSNFRSHKKRWLTYSLKSSRDDLRIIVGERSDIRDEITEYIGSGLLISLLLLLPVALWLLWQVVGIALKPLQQVTDQVRLQNLADLKPINVEGVPDEINPLVTSLNQMITDLEAAYVRERRFVSDASHELRNPLAALLIHVDNALEECEGDDLHDSLENMKVSIQRLSHLVSQLLELSHAENPQTIRKLESVDLVSVCAKVIDRLRPQANKKQLKIDSEFSDDCRVAGVEALLDSLVANLVDNAIKYSDDKNQIRVSCTQSDVQALLVVEDSGNGLDATQRSRVMERFYRVPDSKAPGSGLGLSIVSSIAQIHSAQIRLDESELGGLKIEIRFSPDLNQAWNLLQISPAKT